MNSQPEDSFSVSVQSGLLNDIVKPVVEIAEDSLANFRWSKNGLHLSSVDPANAILVNQYIPQSSFCNYEVFQTPEPFVFGTPCDTIFRLLKAADLDEIVTMHMESTNNRMNIQFSDVNYSLAGVNPDDIVESEMPELNYSSEILVNSIIFRRAQYIIGMISESMTLKVTNQIFVVKGSGDNDMAEIEVELSPKSMFEDSNSNPSAAIINLDDVIESRYGTKYIHHINEFTPDGVLNVKFDEDYPLYISTTRSSDRIESEILIAPRMDSNIGHN